MDYSIQCGALETSGVDSLILGYYETHRLSSAALALDSELGGFLQRTLQQDAATGKPGQITLLHLDRPHGPSRIILAGLGTNEILSAKDYRTTLTAAIKAGKDAGARRILSTLTATPVSERDATWKVRQAIMAAGATLYEFRRMKSEPAKTRPDPEHIIFHLDDPSLAGEGEVGLSQGRAIAAAMNAVKDLANLPGNVCTPGYLADHARALAKAHKKLKARILDEADMEELGMGALLSVARGSRQEARMIVLEYAGATPKTRPVVLVGKGLTFDAGGISIKPAAGMDEMKYDMCGGATVLGAVQAVAEMHMPINLIGLIPATENLPGGNANKPGDIVTSMAGLTIEILNTDAEGRLILCDALAYAERFDPEIVIDLATLTGACVVALGRQPSGLMGNDDALCADLLSAGEISGDRAWRLPIWEEYHEQIKSNFADLANIGGPDGGAITAACFLSRFTKKFRWAHLDIAGTAWRTGKDKGATARPLPLIMQYLLDRTRDAG